MTGSGDASGDPQQEALYERIAEVGERLHDLELSSADSIGTRAGTLIGFAGVVLTLTVALSRDAFGPGVELGSVGDPASAVLFVLSVVCLLLAAVQGVRSARPRERDRVNSTVLDTYRQEKPPVADVDEHFGRQQQTAVRSLEGENSARAKGLQWGFRWLGAGICLVAGQAVIIGVNRLTEVV